MKQIYTILFLLVWAGAWGQSGRLHRLAGPDTTVISTRNYSQTFGINTIVNDYSLSTSDIDKSETIITNKVVGPLLNTHPVKVNQGLAFSVFKLRDDYTGPCWTVRNAALDTADIPFNANGVIDGDSLLSFASGGSAWLIRWYAQDVNGVNAWQHIDSTSFHPQVVNSGALYYIDDANTIPAVNFNGDYMINETTFSMTGSSFSHIHVSDIQSTNEMFVFSIGIPNAPTGSRIGNNLSSNVWIYSLEGTGLANAGGTYAYSTNTPYAHFGFSRADSIGMYINNEAGTISSSNPDPITTWQNTFTLGAVKNISTGLYYRNYRGYVAEFVAWAEDKSNSRNSIYENANLRYNLSALQDSNAIYSVNDTTIVLPEIDSSIANRKVNFLLTGDDQNVTFTSTSGFLYNGLELDSLTFRNSIRNAVEFVPVYYLGTYRWMLTKKNQVDYGQIKYAATLKADSIVQVIDEDLPVGAIIETQYGQFMVESTSVNGFTADSILSLSLSNGNYANYQPYLGTVPYSHVHRSNLYFQDVVVKAANYLDSYLGGGVILIDQNATATDEISDYDYANVAIQGVGISKRNGKESPAVYVNLNDSSKDVINTPVGPTLYHFRMSNLSFVTQSNYDYIINIRSGTDCLLESINISSSDDTTRWGNGIYFRSYDGVVNDVTIRDCKRTIEGAGPNTVKFKDIHLIECNRGPIAAHSHWDRLSIERVDSTAFTFNDDARLELNNLYLETTPADGIEVPVIDIIRGGNVSLTNIFGGGGVSNPPIDSIPWFQIDSVASLNIENARIQNTGATITTTINTGLVTITNMLEPGQLTEDLRTGTSDFIYDVRKVNAFNIYPNPLPSQPLIDQDSVSYGFVGGLLDVLNLNVTGSLTADPSYFQATGTATPTTDLSGQFTINHGLGATPTHLSVGNLSGTEYNFEYSCGSTSCTVTVYDGTGTSTIVASTGISISWAAFR